MSSLFEKETSFTSITNETFKGISSSKSESGMLQYYINHQSIYRFLAVVAE